MSPKILEYQGFSIGFFSSDGEERPHVHVYRGSDTQANAKFWITKDGYELAHNKGRFSNRDLRKLTVFLDQNRDYILARWMEYFGL